MILFINPYIFGRTVSKLPAQLGNQLIINGGAISYSPTQNDFGFSNDIQDSTIHAFPPLVRNRISVPVIIYQSRTILF